MFLNLFFFYVGSMWEKIKFMRENKKKMDYVVGYIIILVCKFFGFKVLVIGLYSLLSYEIF